MRETEKGKNSNCLSRTNESLGQRSNGLADCLQNQNGDGAIKEIEISFVPAGWVRKLAPWAACSPCPGSQ